MADRSLDELGPVDYLIVEFPAGAQNFTGEGAVELLRLHDAGIIRLMDLLILQKGEDGTSRRARYLDDLGESPARPSWCRLSADRTSTISLQRWIPAASPRPRLREPVGRTVRLGHATCRWAVDRQRPDPDPGHHRRRRG